MGFENSTAGGYSAEKNEIHSICVIKGALAESGRVSFHRLGPGFEVCFELHDVGSSEAGLQHEHR